MVRYSLISSVDRGMFFRPRNAYFLLKGLKHQTVSNLGKAIRDREQFAVYPYAFLLIEAHFPFCPFVLIRFRAEKAVSSFHEWRIQTFKIAPHFIKTIYFFRLRLNTRECKLLPKKPPNAFSLASTSLLPVMPLQMHLTPIRIEPSYPLLIDVFIDYRWFCHRLRRSRKTAPNLPFEIEGGFSRGDIIPDRI